VGAEGGCFAAWEGLGRVVGGCGGGRAGGGGWGGGGGGLVVAVLGGEPAHPAFLFVRDRLLFCYLYC
jgi:hypothetical protein